MARTNNTPTPTMAADVLAFSLGSIVARKIAPEVLGMVTGITYRATGVVYVVQFRDTEGESDCYAIELVAGAAPGIESGA